jgi:hypothetical protein
MRLATRLQAHERTLKTIVGKNKECPSLIWFYPKEKSLRDWLIDPIARITQNPIMVAFVCPVSLNIVKCGPDGVGWEVKNPKIWVKKWGPALLTTVRVLQVALTAGRLLTGLPIPVPSANDLGLGCVDTPKILTALNTAWTVFDTICKRYKFVNHLSIFMSYLCNLIYHYYFVSNRQLLTTLTAE